MRSIKYCDIPKWLHKGGLYRSLSPDNPEEFIQIPADCFAYNEYLTVEMKLDDFCQLIQITLFWVLEEIPVGVLDFCSQHNAELWEFALLSVQDANKSELFKPMFGMYPFRNRFPFETIFATGRLELIMHALRLLKDSKLATAFATLQGSLPVLKNLHKQGFAWHEEVFRIAAKEGHLSIMQYAHQQGLEWHVDVMKNTALHGHLDCLQYAHENGCPWDVLVPIYAVQEGHLHIMQYAHQQGFEWDPEVCMRAAMFGHLSCLQFAHENGCPWSSKTVRCAAQEGHLTCLQYLLEQGCPVDEAACNHACMKNGNLPCLQLFHAQAAPWDKKTSKIAAMCPDVACLQYLHENGCPWDDQTPSQAADSGSIECLRYTMEQGCPYKSVLMLFAAKGGHLECLQHLVEDQLLLMDEMMFRTALLRGSLTSLQYLVDQGCPNLESSFVNAALYFKEYDDIFVKDNPEFTQCVRYAVERGWTINFAFCYYIYRRDAECVAYLRSEGLFMEEAIIDMVQPPAGRVFVSAEGTTVTGEYHTENKWFEF